MGGIEYTKKLKQKTPKKVQKIAWCAAGGYTEMSSILADQ
jgi:hypothetical protein